MRLDGSEIGAGLLGGVAVAGLGLAAMSAVAFRRTVAELPIRGGPPGLWDGLYNDSLAYGAIGLIAGVGTLALLRRGQVRPGRVAAVSLLASVPMSLVVFVLEGVVTGREFSVGRE